MFKLLLINPSNVHKGLGNIRSTAWPPLNLPYIASLTPNNYEIEVIDENIMPFEFKEADIVGITSYTSQVNRGYQIAQMYREKGIKTVMGGIHVSMMPDEALEFCDSVVIGEAETVWAQVLKDFESGQLKEKYEGEWSDLQNLSIPRRDILKNEYYAWGSIQTSRGCPMNCAFCSVTAFNGRRYRRRVLEEVIEELQQVPQKNIMITDDNIIGHSEEDKEWAKNFFRRIVKEGIKKNYFVQASIQFGEDKELIRLAAKAGVKILFVGIESVNSDSLKAYQNNLNLKKHQENKYQYLISNIRKGGIAVLGAFVLGGDEDEISIFDTTYRFIVSSGIDVLQVTKPTPLPGTQLWHELSSKKRIIKKNYPSDWDDYRLTKMVYKPEKMSIEDVYEGFTYLRMRYFGFGQRIMRTLSTLFTTKNVTTTLIAYKINESYRKAFINSEHYRLYSNNNFNGFRHS
jgi:radical SAM superfamily enzyme YgiQ (UPF0313 family)